MKSPSILPILTTDRRPETRRFCVDLLGFELCYEHPFYLGVRAGSPGAPELGFMKPDAERMDTVHTAQAAFHRAEYAKLPANAELGQLIQLVSEGV